MSRAVALSGSAIFALAMVSLHFLRRDLSPLDHGMSRYAGAGTLPLATAGFLALAVSLLGVWRLLRNIQPTVDGTVLAAAAGLILVAATPIGNAPTHWAVEGLHTIGGLVFYLGITSAMFATSSNVADRWINRAMSVALALFLLGAAGMPGLGAIVGLLQRAVFAISVLWITRTGLRRSQERPA